MGRVVRFPPPEASRSGSGSSRCGMCRPLSGAVEAFFAHRDLVASADPQYLPQSPRPHSAQALGGDRLVTDLDPLADSGRFCRAVGWPCASSTWNTRRIAVQAFASPGVDERWPLAEDPLAEYGAPPAEGPITPGRSCSRISRSYYAGGGRCRCGRRRCGGCCTKPPPAASEVLALDVEDLDRARRRARIRSKGGNVDMVVWAAPTARLLGRYLAARTGVPCS